MLRSGQVLGILKGDSTGFSGGLYNECERKNRIKNGSKVLSCSAERMGLLSAKGQVSSLLTPLSASFYQCPFFTFLIF